MTRRPDNDLERFVDAQEGIGVRTSCYTTALQEICAGEKASHWIWYIFPQLKGLGHSDYAWYYGISDAAEAAAYLAHPVLGPRLRECCEALLAQPSRDALRIFGRLDYPKVRSCMTLFITVSGDPLFQQVIDEFYKGVQDARTLGMLGYGTMTS